MPYYKITYKDQTGKTHSGIREYHIKSIDAAYDHFLAKLKVSTGEISEYQCYMLSTQSEEYKAWAAARSRRSSRDFPIFPDNRKKKEEGPPLSERMKRDLG